MIVISPYARHSYVSHSEYDFGSILKLMEDAFNLGSLGTTDSTASSMEDVFDFTQAPITFKPEPLPKAMGCKDDLRTILTDTTAWKMRSSMTAASRSSG